MIAPSRLILTLLLPLFLLSSLLLASVLLVPSSGVVGRRVRQCLRT